jgi:hypothetical protein
MMMPLSLSLGAMQMPQWVLNCQHCHKPFTHSEINLVSPASYDPVWPPKPDFPEGGLRMKCPNCKQPSTYQRYELKYTHDQHAGEDGGNTELTALSAGTGKRPVTASAKAAIQSLVKSQKVILARGQTPSKN